MKLSWYSCSMWDKLEWLHWLCFSVRGYLPLIQKIVTYMHGLAVYVKEGIPFAQDLFGFLFMFLTSFTWLCVSYIFLLNQLLSPLSTVFNANSSDIDYVLSINPSANVLFFRDFNIHHNNWLTYSSNNWLTGCPISLDSLWLLLCWLGQSSWPFERYHVPWKDILKVSVSVAASESCERVQFGIDVYIPHPK